MEIIEIIGLLAGACTTLSFVPQVMKSFQTKSVKDFSWLYFLIFGSGLFFWLIYGLFLNSLPIILANAVTLILVLVLIGMKLKYV